MRDADWRAEFERIHAELRHGASQTAARAVVELAGAKA
jgi:hypothetical protein